MRLFRIFLLVFLLAIPLVNANEPVDIQVDNLYIEALTQSVEISPCEAATFEFRLTNIGSIEDTFYLGVDPFAGNARLSRNTIVLKPSLPQVVKVYITPDCAVYGDFEVSLLAQSKSLEALFSEVSKLNIIPNDVLLIAPAVSKVKAGYEPSFVELSLNNIGPRDTTYNLSLETAVDWIKLKPELITIPAGSFQSAKLFVLPPQTAEEGIYEATVVAKVDSGREYAKTLRVMLKNPDFNSYLEAKVASVLHFFASYWWKILLAIAVVIFVVPAFVLFFIWRSATKEIRKEIKEQRQKDSEKQKQEKLRNNIEQQRQIESQKREAENLAYNNLRKKAVPILRRELRKEFKFIPRIQSLNIIKSFGFMLFVLLFAGVGYLAYAFYDAILYFKLYAISALSVLLLCSAMFFLVRTIKSRRIKARLLAVDAEKIKREIKDKLFADYNLIHKSVVRKFGSGQWIFWLGAASFFISMSVLSFFVLSPVYSMPIFNLLGFGLLVPAVFSIIFATLRHCLYLKNTARFFFGQLQAKKQLAVSLEWLGGLHKLAFSPSSKLEHAALLVRKFTKFAEKPGDRVYQYFEIESHNLPIKEAKCFFSIKKSWLESDRPKLMQFTDRWVNVPAAKASEDEKFFYYEAYINSLDAIFAIATKSASQQKIGEIEKQPEQQLSSGIPDESEPPVGKKKLHYFIFAVSLLLVAVVISTAFYSMQFAAPQEPLNIEGITQIEEVTNYVAGLASNMGAGIPSQRWIENTEQRLGLANYFNDPDNEDLIFSASPVEHISIRFEKNTAILAPDFSWNGKTTVIFKATDSDGATASSNLVELIVEPAPERVQIQQFFASFKPFIKYFLLGIVMVIAVLALFELKRD